MKIWTSNKRFKKNIIIWKSRSAKYITDMAGMSKQYEALQDPDQDIFDWCHMNFIKPRTYSALLPPKAYDSPHL